MNTTTAAAATGETPIAALSAEVCDLALYASDLVREGAFDEPASRRAALAGLLACIDEVGDMANFYANAA